MEKPKVLMIGPDRSVHGGVSGVVNQYYENGLDQYADILYIGTMREGSRIKKALVALAAYFRFVMALPGYDIVHIHMASDSSYLRKSFFIRRAARSGKRIILHQHGGNIDQYYRSLNAGARKRFDSVIKMADVLLVLTPALKEFFSGIIEADRIIVFPNSVKITSAVKKEPEPVKMLFLGRICRDKGIGDLLDVMPEISGVYPGVQLVIGGLFEDSSYEGTILSMKDNVKYAGWVTGEEKKDLLNRTNIFILPSYYEGQPVSVLEAMAASCAVIGSDIAGIRMMIENNRNGILFPAGDKEALRNAILMLIKDPELCRRLGANARECVEREYSLDRNMERLLDLYQRILNCHEEK